MTEWKDPWPQKDLGDGSYPRDDDDNNDNDDNNEGTGSKKKDKPAPEREDRGGDGMGDGNMDSQNGGSQGFGRRRGNSDPGSRDHASLDFEGRCIAASLDDGDSDCSAIPENMTKEQVKEKGKAMSIATNELFKIERIKEDETTGTQTEWSLSEKAVKSLSKSSWKDPSESSSKGFTNSPKGCFKSSSKGCSKSSSKGSSKSSAKAASIRLQHKGKPNFTQAEIRTNGQKYNDQTWPVPPALRRYTNSPTASNPIYAFSYKSMAEGETQARMQALLDDFDSRMRLREHGYEEEESNVSHWS
jgi:hypothetical protein